jgi:DNA mismatch repair ATPase MutS
MVLIDEIGRGTESKEGVAISFAILNYLVQETSPFVIVSSH